jgi:excisionase family DNA binding protein
MTVRQAAEQLGLHETTLRAWIAQGRIGIVRLGRAVRVAPEEVARLIAENTVPARDVQRGQSKTHRLVQKTAAGGGQGAT